MTAKEGSRYPLICPWCLEHPTRLTVRGDALMCSSRVKGPDGRWDGCDFRQMVPEGFRKISRDDSGASCPLCGVGTLRLTRANNALMCSSRHQDALGAWVGCNYYHRISSPPAPADSPPNPEPIPSALPPRLSQEMPSRRLYFNHETYSDFLVAIDEAGLGWVDVACLCERHDFRPICTGPDSAKDLHPTSLGVLAAIIRAESGRQR